jgi:hypothetical protein
MSAKIGDFHTGRFAVPQKGHPLVTAGVEDYDATVKE